VRWRKRRLSRPLVKRKRRGYWPGLLYIKRVVKLKDAWPAFNFRFYIGYWLWKVRRDAHWDFGRYIKDFEYWNYEYWSVFYAQAFSEYDRLYKPRPTKKIIMQQL
jgi:hypothetical protein